MYDIIYATILSSIFIPFIQSLVNYLKNYIEKNTFEKLKNVKATIILSNNNFRSLEYFIDQNSKNKDLRMINYQYPFQLTIGTIIYYKNITINIYDFDKYYKYTVSNPSYAKV